MEPRIQYCTTSDGVSLAYWTVGDGRPIIAMPVPGFSHAELSWQMFGAIQQPLAAKYRLISYDSRGSGLSDRGIIDFSIEAMLRDLEAAVERSGFDSFVLASWISAAPVALKYAATNPERVSHLILSDGWSKFSDIAESTAYKAGVPLLEANLGTLHRDVRASVVGVCESQIWPALRSVHSHVHQSRGDASRLEGVGEL